MEEETKPEDIEEEKKEQMLQKRLARKRKSPRVKGCGCKTLGFCAFSGFRAWNRNDHSGCVHRELY